MFLMITRPYIAIAILFSAGMAWSAQRYPVVGLVLKTDAAHRSFVASCTAIPGYMEAMIMPFAVQDAKALNGIQPSMLIDFTLW